MLVRSLRCKLPTVLQHVRQQQSTNNLWSLAIAFSNSLISQHPRRLSRVLVRVLCNNSSGTLPTTEAMSKKRTRGTANAPAAELHTPLDQTPHLVSSTKAKRRSTKSSQQQIDSSTPASPSITTEKPTARKRARSKKAPDVTLDSEGSTETTLQLALPGPVSGVQVTPILHKLLFDLDPLFTGTVVRRPSARVKSPYVADVELPDGSVVLAHSPALDCAGMIVPGATVHMTLIPEKKGKEEAGDRKCTHSIQISEELREDLSQARVGCNPQLAEKTAAIALSRHLIPELGNYTKVEKQKTFGSMRVDFLLSYENGDQLLLEVKNVVGADYPLGGVPTARHKVGVYTSTTEPYSRTAIFPHGSHKPKIGVVSDRAIKHVHELTQLQGSQVAGHELRCAVLFVVSRSDCHAFRPCHEADMMLAQVLYAAQEAGVLLLAHDVEWIGSQLHWGKPLPVVFGEGTRAAVDEQHLQRVLDFNATDPRTHWKKTKRDNKETVSSQETE